MLATLKDNVLILNFKGDKVKMNELLDPISNKYEGPLVNREGHNFPVEAIPVKHPQLAKYRDQCAYVIGIYNTRSLAHELLHAKYYLDSSYRTKITAEWTALPETTQRHIFQFLRRLGYSEDVLLDEYQAYRYTEASNFFGVKLA
jgi:hypothetical protein